MNLYLLSRTEDQKLQYGHGDWIGYIVVAENEEEAKKIHPNEREHPVLTSDEFNYESREDCWRCLFWPDASKKEEILVTYLGQASPDLQPGLILSSNMGS